MPQEPNINLDKIKRINDPVMPVPRKNSKRLAENPLIKTLKPSTIHLHLAQNTLKKDKFDFN